MKRVVVFCALVAAGAAAACSRAGATAETKAEPPAVAVAPVARADLSQVLTIAAEFRPYQEVDVHAKVAGYLKTITVDVGDRVRGGELLGVLEVPELQNELQGDQASVKKATEDINRAQADLERAQSAYQLAHLGATRLEAVIKERPKLIAQQDIDDATARDQEAADQVSTAKATLAAAQGELEFAKATAAKTETLVAYTRITAPFTGVITHRYADPGAMIQSGTSSQTQTMPIVRLSQNDLLRLTVAVPESAVPNIRVGTPVTVRVPALNQTFVAPVSRFSDQLDTDTRTMQVEIDVKNPKFEFVPGMYAQVDLPLKEANGALTVPIEALDQSVTPPRVFVVTSDGRIDVRTVAIELRTPNRVAVSGRLDPGDLVVIGNHGQLEAGARVTPKRVAEPTAAGEK